MRTKKELLELITGIDNNEFIDFLYIFVSLLKEKAGVK